MKIVYIFGLKLWEVNYKTRNEQYTTQNQMSE